jgi:endo-1,4-beta-xylanase
VSLVFDEGIYRWAREADPNAQLIINDYYVMANGYPPFFNMLQKAIKNGVPFDAIGIQAHEPRTMRFPLDQVQRVLDRYATLGKDVHITEFTPTSGNKPITGSHIEGNWDEAAQSDYATKFYTICFAHPAVKGVTWWDLCDDGSWLDGGGMLRKDMSPKPVYLALKQLIKERWTTKTEGMTDADGKFSFRGFYGKYVARISLNGKVIEHPFHVSQQKRNATNIILGEDMSNQPDPGDSL